jgi:type I restriction enzyme S subunit
MNSSPQWRYESEFWDDPHLGRVPIDWNTVKLGQLLSGCQYGLSQSLAESGRYPVFRMNNIQEGRLIASPLVYVDLPDCEFARYRLKKGDVLLNRTNSLDLVGKVGLFDLEGDFVFASYLIRLVVNSPNDSRFVNYFLNSYEGQKRIGQE